MVGERGAGHLAGPGGQAVSGGGRGRGRGLVAARPGSFGQVGAGAHAHCQQPPAQNGQVCGLKQWERLLHLGQGVAGAPGPHRQLRGPPRRLAGSGAGAVVGGDGVDQLPPRGGGIDIAAQQVDLGAGLVHDPVIAVRWPGSQRVDQRRGLGRAPTGEQGLACVEDQDGGLKRSLPGRPAGRAQDR